MSQAKEWKFQLVGGCDWQVGVVCGGGGSFQSSVTKDESSYGKAEFPLRLEISVCKAPGSPYLPKLTGVHSRLVIFPPGFRLSNDSWVCWTVLVHWCLSDILNLREKANESSNAVFFPCVLHGGKSCLLSGTQTAWLCAVALIKPCKGRRAAEVWISSLHNCTHAKTFERVSEG